MSNTILSHLPSLPERPREHGLTMMMDKGICLRQAEDFLSASGHLADIIKLGFGTSLVSRQVKEKVQLYHKAGMKVYVGGTLFEAFLIRNDIEGYMRYIDDLGLDTVEVSDGSIQVEHKEKCKLIEQLAAKYRVVSEVGSKEAGILIAPAKWISMMKAELNAGSWKVIAEARESGNVGIYRPNGTAHVVLVNRILSKVPSESIIWEAPLKAQQAWFIKHIGSDVNLGNIAHDDVIPLETLRLGLRGDTFFQFLPEELKKLKQTLA